MYSRPIRGQYPGNLIILGQSEARIQVIWSLLTNERPIQVTWCTLEQSEAYIQVTWSLSANQRPVLSHLITLDQWEACIHPCLGVREAGCLKMRASPGPDSEESEHNSVGEKSMYLVSLRHFLNQCKNKILLSVKSASFYNSYTTLAQ